MYNDKQAYERYLSLVESLQPFCVFGFGSLIWAPDFEYEKKVRARAEGYHRRFGMWSVHYRGTAAQPRVGGGAGPWWPHGGGLFSCCGAGQIGGGKKIMGQGNGVIRLCSIGD